MIRLSEHGLVMRREKNWIMLKLAGRNAWYIEPADGRGFTPAQIAVVKRIAYGEYVDDTDPGYQVAPHPVQPNPILSTSTAHQCSGVR